MKKIHPNQIHIVGSKNSGKTYLTEFLIRWFRQKKIDVGAIKHTVHSHPLDKEGTDSYKFKDAGAGPVTFITNEGMSLIIPENESSYELLSLAYRNCDILLVESFKNTPNDKIVIEPEKLEFNNQNIIAVLTASGKHEKYPAFKHDDDKLGEFLIEKYLL